jgi:hypothetical protein
VTSKRSPEDILSDIEDSEADDEIERVLAMTPEERRRELGAGGFDMASLHARADALYAEVHRAEQDAPSRMKVVPLPAPRRRPARTVWAISLIAAAFVVAFVVMSVDAIVGKSPEPTRLRSAAYAACDARRWGECKEKLDQARDIDREGESDPRVVAARTALREAKP